MTSAKVDKPKATPKKPICSITTSKSDSLIVGFEDDRQGTGRSYLDHGSQQEKRCRLVDGVRSDGNLLSIDVNGVSDKHRMQGIDGSKSLIVGLQQPHDLSDGEVVPSCLAEIDEAASPLPDVDRARRDHRHVEAA